MDTARTIVKGLAGICGMVATGYCWMGLMCMLYGGMALADMPEWWWCACVVSAAFALVGLCAGMRGLLWLRWERQEARRLGYVRIENGTVVYRK